jgi:hypothetical protein
MQTISGLRPWISHSHGQADEWVVEPCLVLYTYTSITGTSLQSGFSKAAGTVTEPNRVLLSRIPHALTFTRFDSMQRNRGTQQSYAKQTAGVCNWDRENGNMRERHLHWSLLPSISIDHTDSSCTNHNKPVIFVWANHRAPNNQNTRRKCLEA